MANYGKRPGPSPILPAIMPVAASQRKMRRPQHRFILEHKPWQIQPFLIAPVLPGETMRNLLLQSRVVTDPLVYPLGGWWLEYFVFYVKHRDLNGSFRTELVNMVLDPTWNARTASLTSDVDVAAHYFKGGSAVPTPDVDMIDWVAACLERVTEVYFRTEGEAWNDFTIDSMPSANISQDSLTDTLLRNEDYLVEDFDVDVDLNADGTITAGEVMSAQERYLHLRETGLLPEEMTYEQFLNTYGIRDDTVVEEHEPELLRYVRSWTYPTNTIDPSDGSPSTACSWAIAERADKDRFFKEPGFIFGVTVARPKVYLLNQKGTATAHMVSAASWLPPAKWHDVTTGFINPVEGYGIFDGIADASGAPGSYWFDIRDLLLYGEQFTNFAIAVDQEPVVSLPSTTANARYATAADALNLFNDQVTPLDKIRQDGVVSLNLAGRLQDYTAQTLAPTT